MAVQFIIDGIGYDLWPLAWERAERIASFNEPLASIIADAQVIYYCEAGDLERFVSLKQKIADAVRPENSDALLAKARDLLIQVKAQFVDAYASSDYPQVRSICSQILEQLTLAICYVNSTYPRKGAAGIREEADSFHHQPHDFIKLYDQLITSSDTGKMIHATAALIKSVEAMVRPVLPSGDCEISNKTVKGLYEEIKSAYNKLIMACDARDYTQAYFAANAISRETESAFGKRAGEFPDLMIPIEDFDELKRLAIAHEEVMLDILRQHSIDTAIYDSADEFRRDWPIHPASS